MFLKVPSVDIDTALVVPLDPVVRIVAFDGEAATHSTALAKDALIATISYSLGVDTVPSLRTNP